MRVASRYGISLVLSALIILSVGRAWGQRTAITPRDCVGVKYINGVWMNWSGTQVAYLVKSPNIDQNRNDYQLYVREIADKSFSSGKLLITGTEISSVQWLRDDSRIAMLMSIDGVTKLIFVNVATAARESTIEASGNIQHYTVDAAGSAVVYSTAETQKKITDTHGSSQEEIASGYRIIMGGKETSGWPVSTIYLRRREPSGAWSAPHALTIENPVTHIKTIQLLAARGLSLSPNGSRLLFTYFSNAIPDEWKTDFLVKEHPYTADSMFEIMVLYEMDTASTSIAFKSISPASVPLWANDSSSFLVNGRPPIGSRWEAEDIQNHQASVADGDLFWINVDSGKVEEVLRNVPDHHDGPLYWQKDGDVIVRSASATIARLRRYNDAWREVDHLTAAQKEGDRFLYMVSDGKEIIGTREAVNTPRDLFVYGPGQVRLRLLTDLNPQLRELRFAPVETVHWTTASGLNVSGLLFTPPDFTSGTRYPLVINTKGNDGLFTCDAGYIDDPSFAPQPIATSGMMYLIRTEEEGRRFQEELDNRPRGYPGGIGEAVQQMDIWDSAVDTLEKRGLIDASKVGIIGFSRTGWHVEFDLVHSKTRYAAATAADNVQYSLGEYWLLPAAQVDEERMYGGPPYGKTLANWQKYSISFNLEKVHTPLLVEVMGYGAHDDNQFSLPKNLAIRYEVYGGLARLG